MTDLVPRPQTFAALATASDASGCVFALDAGCSATSSEVLARDAPASPSTSPTFLARALVGSGQEGGDGGAYFLTCVLL